MMGEGSTPFSSSLPNTKPKIDVGCENRIDLSNHLPSENMDEILKKQKKKRNDGKASMKATKKTNRDKTEEKKDPKKDKSQKPEGKKDQPQPVTISNKVEQVKGQTNSKTRKKNNKSKSIGNELKEESVIITNQEDAKDSCINILQKRVEQTEPISQTEEMAKEEDTLQNSKLDILEGPSKENLQPSHSSKKKGKKSKGIKNDATGTTCKEVSAPNTQVDIADTTQEFFEDVLASDKDKKLWKEMEAQFPILDEILYPEYQDKADAFCQTFFTAIDPPVSQPEKATVALSKNSIESNDGNAFHQKGERDNPYLNVTHKKLRNLRKKLTRIQDLEMKVQTSKIRDITKILNPEQIELLSIKEPLLGKIKDIESIHNALTEVMMKDFQSEENDTLNEKDLDETSKANENQKSTLDGETQESFSVQIFEKSDERAKVEVVEQDKLLDKSISGTCNNIIMEQKECIIMEKSVFEAMRNAYFHSVQESLQQAEFHASQREKSITNLKKSEKKLKEIKDKYSEAELHSKELKLENLDMEKTIKILQRKLSICAPPISSDILKTTIKEISMYLGVNKKENEKRGMSSENIEDRTEKNGGQISTTDPGREEETVSLKTALCKVEPEDNLLHVDTKEENKSSEKASEVTVVDDTNGNSIETGDTRMNIDNSCGYLDQNNKIQNRDFTEAPLNNGNLFQPQTDMRPQMPSIPFNNYIQQMQQYHQQLQHFLFQHYPPGYPIPGLPPPLPSHMPAPHQLSQFPPTPSQIQPSQPPIQQPIQSPYHLNIPPPLTVLNRRMMEMYQECNNLLQQYHHQQQQQQERFNPTGGQNQNSNVETEATTLNGEERIPKEENISSDTVGDIRSLQQNIGTINSENIESQINDNERERSSKGENTSNVLISPELLNVQKAESNLDDTQSKKDDSIFPSRKEGCMEVKEKILKNNILSLGEKPENFPLSFIMNNVEAAHESLSSACPLPLESNESLEYPAESTSVDEAGELVEGRENKASQQIVSEKGKVFTEANSNNSGSGSKKKWYYRNNNKSKEKKQQKC